MANKTQQEPKFRPGAADPWKQTESDYWRSLCSFCVPLEDADAEKAKKKVVLAKSMIGKKLDLSSGVVNMESTTEMSMLIRRRDDTGSSRWIVTEGPQLRYVEASPYPQALRASASMVLTIPAKAKIIDWMGYSATGDNLIEHAPYRDLIAWLKSINLGVMDLRDAKGKSTGKIKHMLAGDGEEMGPLFDHPGSGVFAGESGLAIVELFYAAQHGQSGVMMNTGNVLLLAETPMVVQAVLEKDEEIKSHRDYVKEARDQGLPVPPLVLAEHGMMPVDQAAASLASKEISDIHSTMQKLIISMRHRDRTLRQDIDLDYLTISAAKRVFALLASSALASGRSTASRYQRIHDMFPKLGLPSNIGVRAEGTEDWPDSLVELAQRGRSEKDTLEARENLPHLALLAEQLRDAEANIATLDDTMHKCAAGMGQIVSAHGSPYCGSSLTAMVG